MRAMRKTRPFFPLNQACLIGILVAVYYNPQIAVQYNPLYPKQLGFFIAHVLCLHKNWVKCCPSDIHVEILSLPAHVSHKETAWRIIPVSTQLATMVSKASNWSCSPSKRPTWLTNEGATGYYLLANWDDPPSILSQASGRMTSLSKKSPANDKHHPRTPQLPVPARKNAGSRVIPQCHRIHVHAISTYIYDKYQPNLGKNMPVPWIPGGIQVQQNWNVWLAIDGCCLRIIGPSNPRV